MIFYNESSLDISIFWCILCVTKKGGTFMKSYSYHFCRRTLSHLLKVYILDDRVTFDEMVRIMASKTWIDYDHMVSFLKMYHYIW